LRARIDDDAKDGAGQYLEYDQAGRQSQRRFWPQPRVQAIEYPMTFQGLARLLAQGFVARLANIDILAAARFAP
jgi:hypothetical protein